MDNTVTRCKSCGQRILYIRMKSGKNMPVNETFVNYKLAGEKRDRIVTPAGDVVACTSGVSAEGADGFGYISHFATCPTAARHRKK